MKCQFNDHNIQSENNCNRFPSSTMYQASMINYKQYTKKKTSHNISVKITFHIGIDTLKTTRRVYSNKKKVIILKWKTNCGCISLNKYTLAHKTIINLFKLYNFLDRAYNCFSFKKKLIKI
jgi:hypothetical protein